VDFSFSVKGIFALAKARTYAASTGQMDAHRQKRPVAGKTGRKPAFQGARLAGKRLGPQAYNGDDCSLCWIMIVGDRKRPKRGRQRALAAPSGRSHQAVLLQP